MTLYKVTGPNGEPLHGGTGTWPLPKTDRLGRVHPAKWRRIDEDRSVIACRSGLHLTDERSLVGWLPAKAQFRVWEAEGRGESSAMSDKVAFREARLVRLVAEVVSPDLVVEWSRFTKADPSAGLAVFRAFDDFLAERARLREEMAERERQAARTEALIAARHGHRLVFWQHHLPIPERECPAWPSSSDFERAIDRRTDARARKILGVTERMERLVRRSGFAPEVVELVYGVAS